MFLLFIAVVLAILGFLAEYLRNFYNYEQYRLVKQFVRIFNLGEGTVQTWFSSSLFLFCSFLLLVIAYVKKRINGRFILHWAFLSLLFLGFSIDEFCEIHERFNLFHIKLGSGSFKYTWVLFAIPFLLIIYAGYMKFIKHLPSDIRRLVLLAAGLFLGGTLGIEVIGGVYKALQSEVSIFNIILGTTEETLEMAGSVVFLYALASYINFHMKELKIYVEENSLFKDLDLPVREVPKSHTIEFS